MNRPWSTRVPDGSWDAIVIGSGIAGLTTAAMLARKRLKVLVLEQHHTPGGLTQTFTRGPFRFDTGLHVLGELDEGSLPRRILDDLTGGEARFVHLGPVVERLHTRRGAIDVLAGRRAAVRGLEASFPGSGERARAFLEAAERGARATSLALLARNLPDGLDGLLDAATVRHGEALLAQSAGEWMAHWLGDDPVRQVFEVRSGFHGTPIAEASAGAQAAVTHHYADGAWAPAPDSRAIARGLCRTIAAAGGWTALSAPVARIEVAAGAVQGVLLEDGRRLRAPRVVAAVGAHNAVRLLDSPPEPWGSALCALKPSSGHVGLYLGFDADPVRFGATAASHWAEIHHPLLHGVYVRFHGVGLGGAPRATVSSAVDRARLPEGGAHRDRSAAYAGLKAELEAALIERVEALFPGIGRTIVHRELSTPMTTEHYARAPRGAMYGLAATVARFACPHLRAATPVPGLFLGGTDVGMSGVIGGLMAGTHSAVAMHPRSFSLVARGSISTPGA